MTEKIGFVVVIVVILFGRVVSGGSQGPGGPNPNRLLLLLTDFGS